MKKKLYRLATVVDVRRKDKEIASLEVTQRRTALEHEQLELADLENALKHLRFEITDANDRLRNELRTGTTAALIVSHKSFVKTLLENESSLIRQVKEKNHSVNNARQALESAISGLAEASKELSVIEKHKEKWQSDEDRRLSKKEQKRLDEISSILHERPKKL